MAGNRLSAVDAPASDVAPPSPTETQILIETWGEHNSRTRSCGSLGCMCRTHAAGSTVQRKSVFNPEYPTGTAQERCRESGPGRWFSGGSGSV